MVSLDLVRSSNAQLRELGPGLVALFVGGTSGIGEYTLKAFVRDAVSPRVYLVGRNTPAAERIITECGGFNKEAKVEFFKADVSELGEVDRVCKEIIAKEGKVNLLVQTQGNLNLNGRNESPEGLDRKFTLNFYSRARFIHNLLPLLQTASTQPPHFSRTLSVLGPGNEGPLNLNDLSLKTTFRGDRCANHTIVMNDFFAEELAKKYPAISFTHNSPGVVDTGIVRGLPLWARVGVRSLTPLLKLFMVGKEETGERHLFLATSGVYAPRKANGGDGKGEGVKKPEGLEVAVGSDGVKGSGAYLVNWDGEITGKQNLIKEYREKGVGKIVWEHTLGIFDEVEKKNRERAAAGSA